MFLTDEAVRTGNGTAVSNKQAQRVVSENIFSTDARFCDSANRSRSVSANHYFPKRCSTIICPGTMSARRSCCMMVSARDCCNVPM